MSLYAVNAGWLVQEFVPNAFFYGVVVNVFSVATHGAPQLTTAQWGWSALALIVGMLVGRGLTGRLSEQRARWLVLGLAMAGGLTTLAKGAAGL